MINSYKSKKTTIENNHININTNNFNESNSNSIQINNINKPIIYNNKHSKINNYKDLSPFYYISNGNKASNKMWGYNDKIKYKNERNNNKNKNLTENSGLSRDDIIQNKLRIFKDKISQPFLDKVEKEKKNEYKRIQILNKINDPTIKENLETKFAIERGKIDMELTREKERINKAIRNYEESLLQSENIDNVIVPNTNNIFFE